jgi:hypothetical protein
MRSTMRPTSPKCRSGSGMPTSPPPRSTIGRKTRPEDSPTLKVRFVCRGPEAQGARGRRPSEMTTADDSTTSWS